MRGLRRAGTLLSLALLSAAPAAGQTPSSPPPPNVVQPSPAASGPKGDSAPVTLTGCLERARRDPSSPQAGVAEAQAPYVLRTASQAGREPVLYQVLPANDGIKLAEHLGHRVEITAVMRAATNAQPGRTNEGVSPSMRSTGMETLPSPAPKDDQAAAMSITQPLMVNALKMLDVTCEGSKP